MKNDKVDEEEQWNLSLLGFFLSLHNEQAKTSNIFLKSYELLRLILSKL